MARARISQYIVEALVPTDTFSLATVSGGGVSQYVIEALVTNVNNKTRLSQYVVEVLFAESESQSTPGEGGSTPSTHTSGYAV